MPDEQRNLTANFTANASGFARGSNEVIQHLRELNTEMSEVRNSIRNTNTQMRTYERQLEALRRETNNGENATEQQRREMRQLEDAIAQCNVELGQHRTAQQRLQSEIRSTNRRLDEQRQEARSVSQAFSNMGDVLKANLLSSAITNGLQELLYLLKSAATYAYDVGSSFEAAMSQVGAVSGASVSELEALTEKAKEMGATTKFTATESAEALNYMAMAGWKTEDMLSGIDGVINLAAASGEELGTVSDIVTDALTAFGLAAKDSAHFADVLAAASANSNTNVAMMGETFSYAAPIAGALGYSIEDTAVAIGIMANSGIKASQAGTALRTIMTNLSGDVEIAGDNIGKVTIATTNADGSMREFSDIIADLRTAFAGLTESEKTSTAESIAGKYAMSGFLSLMNAGEQDVVKLTAAIENCNGAASSMADTMQNNLKGSVTIMQSALEVLGISLYEKFDGGLKDAVEILTEGIGQLDENIKGGYVDKSVERLSNSFVKLANAAVQVGTEAIPDFINGIADVISFVVDFREEIGAAIQGFISYKVAIGTGDFITEFVKSCKALGTTFRTLTSATESATAAQNANNAVVAANPYALIATAIGLAVTATTAWLSSLDDCNEKMQDLNTSAKHFRNTAEEYSDTADGVKKIAEEYKKVNETVKNAVDKNTELRSIQQQLIDQYGEQAAGIDLVNGAYDEQLAKLNSIISRNNELSDQEVTQARLNVRDAEKESTAVKFSDVGYGATAWGDNKEMDAANLLMQTLMGSGIYEGRSLNHLYIGGSYEERIALLQGLMRSFENAGLRDTQVAADILSQWNTLDAAKANRDYVNSALGTTAPVYTGSRTAEYYQANGEAALREEEKRKAAAAELKEQQQSSADELQEEYKTEKQLADDMYSVKELADKEYYAKLTELRDEYLTQNTHEWYAATAELIKLSEQIGNAAEKTADKITASMEDVKDEYNDLMAAIDAELERREREKQDTELQSQIDAVSARLAYENVDEYSRIALEKELAELKAQQEDIAFERNATDSKAQIQAAYDATERLMNMVPAGYDPRAWEGFVNAAFAQISEGYMPNATVQDKRESQKVYNIVINAENMTTNQVVDAVKNAIASGAI